MEQPPLVGYIPAPPGAATPSRTHPLQVISEPKQQSATSGKAGGLSEVERLKAAWPFGR